ncbi:hypothetical protein F2Q68_00019339 [Brassica cretica]|uniref:Protein root UVB sensitive/RUS domain-containing protein n=1 Tax=Brassica cretica TaxID=69181 RepID=A0A8S9FSY8_BRACR|nr:hypothetical protein F2Q68_00019339 [Brassica cretica]
MHSSLKSNPSSRLFLNPSKSTPTRYPIFTFPGKSSPNKSLRTSIDVQQEGASKKEEEHLLPSNGNRRLPIVIKTSGRVSRYFLKGDSFELVCLDDDTTSFSHVGFLKLIKLSSSAAKDFFIPKQVSDSYVSYVKWKFLHRVFSSALQVLATQAMFRAIGIGQSRSLASSAAFNWILKDGLGRLCRCIYTASLASAFDTNLKRVRFSTSLLFSLSIGVELMTPLFPRYFLLLASIANIAKQISLSCYLATGVITPRIFSLVCFRMVPIDDDEKKCNSRNLELLEAVNSSGKLFISHTALSGKIVLRCAIGAPLTEEKHVTETWKFPENCLLSAGFSFQGLSFNRWTPMGREPPIGGTLIVVNFM